MKKFSFLILIITVFALGCNNTSSEIKEERVTVRLTFNHFWESLPISSTDFSQLKFRNQNGDRLSIERIRYLISNIKLTDASGNVLSFKDYNLLDVTNNKNLTFILSNNILAGNYQNIEFTFGFKDEDNLDGVYQDLNVTNFNIPNILGGGYHYMQLDGKYVDINNLESSYNFHVIRAVNPNQVNPRKNLPDTSFLVSLGEINLTKDSEIIIKVDISEWFKNPNLWDLNEFNTLLMPNFEAQKLMNQNGKSVFSLTNVKQ